MREGTMSKRWYNQEEMEEHETASYWAGVLAGVGGLLLIAVILVFLGLAIDF